MISKLKTWALFLLGAAASIFLAMYQSAERRREKAEAKANAREIEADGLGEVIKHQQREVAIKHEKPEDLKHMLDDINRL